MKRDTDPMFIAPTYPPPRRARPRPGHFYERARERTQLCREHVAEVDYFGAVGRLRVYRFRTVTPTKRR